MSGSDRIYDDDPAVFAVQVPEKALEGSCSTPWQVISSLHQAQTEAAPQNKQHA